MTVGFYGHAVPMHARDKRAFRFFVARAFKAATPAIKEACNVALVLVAMLTVMIALAALDVWIWLPHIKN